MKTGFGSKEFGADAKAYERTLQNAFAEDVTWRLVLLKLLFQLLATDTADAASHTVTEIQAALSNMMADLYPYVLSPPIPLRKQRKVKSQRSKMRLTPEELDAANERSSETATELEEVVPGIEALHER